MAGAGRSDSPMIFRLVSWLAATVLFAVLPILPNVSLAYSSVDLQAQHQGWVDAYYIMAAFLYAIVATGGSLGGEANRRYATAALEVAIISTLVGVLLSWNSEPDMVGAIASFASATGGLMGLHFGSSPERDPAPSAGLGGNG